MRTPHNPEHASPLGSRAFRCVIDVAGVPEKGLALTIEAPPSDLPAIAEDCGLPAVGELRVRCKVLPRAGGRFEVVGRLSARVTQVCVVTLEPFVSDVSEDIDVTFAPSSAALEDWFGSDSRQQRRDTRQGRKVEVRGALERGRNAREPLPPVAASVPMNDDTPDAPDPIVDGRIDLGATALEFLVLALDPYPKKPGVAFTDLVAGDDEAEPSAFAALAPLKDSP